MQTILSALANAPQYLLTVRINDIIDIAILTIIFYKLLKFARRTSSGGIALGIILVLVAVVLADQFQLNAVSYILNRVVEIGFIAVIVLFQPEIRHFLETMGRGSLMAIFGRITKTQTEMEQAITETVEAYRSLSADKVGALMVFERSNSLNEYLRNGTELDCAVNAELLKNLFWNKAPLHDGAVIVKDGRIIGAGCMLPMTQNTNLSKDLGMRHRAGIGASEHTDAIVAIVSEETGTISVAVGGMLKRHLAPETLERILRNELLSAENPGETIPQKLNPLKLLKKKGSDEE